MPLNTVQKALFAQNYSQGPKRIAIEPVKKIDSICRTHGAYVGQVFEFTGRNMVSPCPKCMDEEHKKQAQADIEKTQILLREANAKALFRRSMLPDKYENIDLDQYVPGCDLSRYALKIIKNYSKNFGQLQKHGTSLIFYGNHGTGKTFLSCGIAKFIQKTLPQKEVLYCTFGQMIDSIRQSYRNDDVHKTDRIHSFIKPDLLIIDEIGVSNNTNDEYILFNRIMDGRYLATGKSSILISNDSMDVLKNKLGSAIMDRLREQNTMPLYFAWESYRTEISDRKREEIANLLGL